MASKLLTPEYLQQVGKTEDEVINGLWQWGKIRYDINDVIVDCYFYFNRNDNLWVNLYVDSKKEFQKFYLPDFLYKKIWGKVHLSTLELDRMRKHHKRINKYFVEFYGSSWKESEIDLDDQLKIYYNCYGETPGCQKYKICDEEARVTVRKYIKIMENSLVLFADYVNEQERRYCNGI